MKNLKFQKFGFGGEGIASGVSLMIITTIICCILSVLNNVNGMMTLVEQETEVITIRN